MFSRKINVYRGYALAGATLSVAVSVGFLMQSSEPGYAAQALQSTAITPMPDMSTLARLPSGQTAKVTNVEDLSTLPSPPQDISPKADLPTEPVILLVSRDLPVGALPQEEATPSLNCETALTAEPSAAAMVNLTLTAPCLIGERVMIHHSGLKFNEIVGQNGVLSLVVPALSEQAVFVVAFSNGDGAVARTEVSSLPFYDRVAVQWTGDSGLQLHALEFGADYGSDGHVWRDQPRDMSAVASGLGGFITRLGDQSAAEAAMAEVYTFPTMVAQSAGNVSISLEAEISNSNCTKDISAQSFELQQDGDLRVQEISMSLPDCDAAGEFLVLKNLLEDLTIARN